MVSRVVHFLHRRRTRLGLLLIKCRGVERFFKNSREIVGFNKKVRIVCWVSWVNFPWGKCTARLRLDSLGRCDLAIGCRSFKSSSITIWLAGTKWSLKTFFFTILVDANQGFYARYWGMGMILVHWMDKIFKIAPLLVSRKIRRFFLLFHVAFTGSVLQSRTMTRYISLLFQHTWFN